VACSPGVPLGYRVGPALEEVHQGVGAALGDLQHPTHVRHRCAMNSRT
jgi:hypothetical protein